MNLLYKKIHLVLLVIAVMAISGCAELSSGFNSGGSGSSQCFTGDTGCKSLCKINNGIIQSGSICIISSIVYDMANMLDHAQGTLYKGIYESNIIKKTVPLVMTLFVMIFAMMFATGMIQLSAWTAFTAIFKMAIIGFALSPDGAKAFDDIVVKFFREGSADIISSTSKAMAAQFNNISGTSGMIGAGNAACAAEIQTHMMDAIGRAYQNGMGGSTASPMAPVDVLLGRIINQKTLAILQAAGNTGITGWGLTYILVFALGIFFLLGAVAQALWVYLMGMVAMSLLLGLFPLFVIFMLFNRTKGIFDGYIKLLVSFMLQPILLFMFIALFVSMLATSIDGISAKLNICYSCYVEGGSDRNVCSWKFTDSSGTLFCNFTGTGQLDPGYNNGSGTLARCQDIEKDISNAFPSLCIFLLLCYIMQNFVGFVSSISTQIASGMDLSKISGYADGMAKQLGSKMSGEIASKMFK